MDILLDNWAAIALAILAAVVVIVSFTPSKRDDQIVGYLSIIVRTISGKNKNKQTNE